VKPSKHMNHISEPSLLRLQKFIAHAGVASRRQSEELIASGRVKVNGEIVREMGLKVDPAVDRVEVDGKVIERERRVYIMLNKPRGFITTVSDARGRQTVMDLLPSVRERVYPVGRLDADTLGLLLFMNDGKLAFRLTHPSYQVTKVYRALVRGRVDANTLAQMRAGVKLEDGMAVPSGVRVLQRKGDSTLLELKLEEGRKREVKRICFKVGHPVLRLERTGFAFLSLKGLPRGHARMLSSKEVAGLKQLVGLQP